jgi:UMF1 family MFS transporter
MKKETLWRSDVIGWSLYDLANTIFSMNILSLYLKRYIVEDLGKKDYWYDIPYALSMLAAAILLPALGAMSDHVTKKKLFLGLFTVTCCICTAGMGFFNADLLIFTILLFMVANFTYEAAMPFYNTLLYSVAEGAYARMVSGFGVGMGYIGSILGIMLVAPFVSGSLFGWDVPMLDGSGKVGAFLPTACLFALFAIPLFLWVKERPVTQAKPESLKAAYKEVWNGLRETKKYPGVLRFLISDYFFEDAAVTVIINIGLYCSLVLHMPDEQITSFLIISTASAVIGSFIIGKIAKVWSLKYLITCIVSGWVLALTAFVFTESIGVVWLLGSAVGILLGGLWTTTRPMLAELVPQESLGRFFGLFSLSGRSAAVVGPLLWTAMVWLFQPDGPLGRTMGEMLQLSPEQAVEFPYKIAVASLGVMMLIGLLLFQRVPHTRKRPV